MTQRRPPMAIPKAHAQYMMDLVKEIAIRMDLDGWVGRGVGLIEIIMEVITDYECMVAYDIDHGKVPEGFRDWTTEIELEGDENDRF